LVQTNGWEFVPAFDEGTDRADELLDAVEGSAPDPLPAMTNDRRGIGDRRPVSPYAVPHAGRGTDRAGLPDMAPMCGRVDEGPEKGFRLMGSLGMPRQESNPHHQT
jgi:hypothetical protein